MLCAFQNRNLSVPRSVVFVCWWNRKVKKLITCGLLSIFYLRNLWNLISWPFISTFFSTGSKQQFSRLKTVEERMRNNYRLEMFWHAAQWMLIFCMFFLFFSPFYLVFLKMIISVVFDHDELISSVCRRNEERNANEERRKRKSRFWNLFENSFLVNKIWNRTKNSQSQRCLSW